jgi:hypothetical protein
VDHFSYFRIVRDPNFWYLKKFKFIENIKYEIWSLEFEKKRNWVGHFRILYKWVGQILVQMDYDRPKSHWNSSISGL